MRRKKDLRDVFCKYRMYGMSAVPVGRIETPPLPTPANDAVADGPERDPFAGAETWGPSLREEAIVVALAAAAFPGGTALEAGGQGTLSRLYRMMRGAPTAWRRGYRAMLWSAE